MSGGSITQNQSISPDGTQNAAILSGDGVNPNAAYTFINVTTQEYAYSMFAKKGSEHILRMKGFSGGANGNVEFNLINGTIETSSDGTFSNEKIEDYGNGWYRCSVKITVTSSGSKTFGFNREAIVSGDLFSVYGVQLEQGSYATSYIPTSGQANGVTRVAEEGIDGGAGTPIFSNTSAVWFIDLERIGIDTDSSGSGIALRNSSFSQQIRLHFDAPATNIRFRDGVNGYATISTITGANTNVRKKLALRIDGSTLSTFSNGSKIGSDYTAPNSFNIDEVDFSSIGFKIHDMRFYNTALTDQELIALTS